MDIVTSTVSQSKKISRTCRLIFEEPEQKPLFSTLQNLCKKLFAKDWCFQCQVKDFVPSFNMGRHTINSNSFGLLTLTLYLSSDDFFIGNLNSDWKWKGMEFPMIWISAKVPLFFLVKWWASNKNHYNV